MPAHVIVCTGDLQIHPSDLCPCLRGYPASGGVCQLVTLVWAMDHGYRPCPAIAALP